MKMNPEDESEKTYVIPSEPFGDKELRPGDVIHVTGKTPDGDLEVTCEHRGDEDWKKDLEEAMPESFGGSMKGEEAYG